MVRLTTSSAEPLSPDNVAIPYCPPDVLSAAVPEFPLTVSFPAAPSVTAAPGSSDAIVTAVGSCPAAAAVSADGSTVLPAMSTANVTAKILFHPLVCFFIFFLPAFLCYLS